VGLTVVAGTLVGSAGPATALPSAGLSKVNITGHADNGAMLSATFTAAGVARNSTGQLVAYGMLDGTLVDVAGPAHSVTQQMTLPADPIAGASSCQVTDLMLGPRDVDLLGVEVHLDQSQLYTPAAGSCGGLAGQ
jgi:hypothetical protein